MRLSNHGKNSSGLSYKAAVLLTALFVAFVISTSVSEKALAANVNNEVTVYLSNFSVTSTLDSIHIYHNTTLNCSAQPGDTILWTVHIANDTSTPVYGVSTDWEPDTNVSYLEGGYVDNCQFSNTDLVPGGSVTWKLWVKMSKSGTQQIEIRYADGGPNMYNCYLTSKFANGAASSAVSSAPTVATLPQVNSTGSAAVTSQTAATGTSAATTTTAAVSTAAPSVVASSAASPTTNNTAGATVGRQDQGPLGKMLFSQAMPAGWNEACSYNIVTGGSADFSQKSGAVTIEIPQEFRKAGRTFALLGIDKSGQVLTFTDIDGNANTITVNLNLQGYALDLIYKD